MRELLNILNDIRTGALPVWRVPHFAIWFICGSFESKPLVLDIKPGWKDAE